MTAAEISPLRAAGRSVVTYRIGGHDYPLKTNPQCNVCRNPLRFEIEEAIVLGQTYKRIIENLPPEHQVSIASLKHHYPGHMPMDVAVTRQIVEAQAQRVGKRIEDSAESLIDGMTLAQVVVQKTFEAIASGQVSPAVSDGMSAAKFLAEMGEFDTGGVDQAAMTEAFMVYQEQVQSMMTPEQFQAFGRALSRNPVLKALVSRYEGQSEAVPGEVLEDSSRDA